MAKNPIGFTGVSSANYIKQIAAGGQTHDIAVVNGIKFYNGGKDDSVAVTWDGTQELEVVIPTLADIVANPVVLKGVINETKDIPTNPQPGYLVYIGTTGSYFNPAVACEAGDMAVYYDGKWNVISGENQIQLAGTTDASGNHSVVLSETAAKVITVEGKDLSLSVDYADILGKITADGNAEKTISLKNGKTVISGKYLTLSSTTAESKDITTSVSIDLPTALASGAVTISDKVLVSDNFTFTSGSFPTIKKNDAAITVNASHNMTIAASGDGSFVTGVTAIKGVSLSDVSDKVNSDIAYVADLSAVAGKSFVSGIHAHTTSDGDKPVDFTVAGVVTADASVNTFAKGWGAESDSGDVVSSITVGAVTGDFVTGLTGAGTSVLTDVKFGDTIEDTTRKWFVTGLEGDAAAVTDVTFGEVVVTPQTSAAVVSASVNNHVLSFTTGNFMTSATAALSGTKVTTKAFTKGGVKLSGFSSASDTLKIGSVSQANTTISYKSLTTGAVTLSQGTTGFHFDKAESAAYTPVMGYKKVNVTAADVSKAGAVLENTAITANIPADQVVVDLNAGTLPSLTIAAPTGTLSGTVGTELTKVSKDWLAVNPDKKMIAGATTWSLVESSDATEGSIGFAKAGTYDVQGNTVIDANSFIAAVKVSGTLVPTTPKETV